MFLAKGRLDNMQVLYLSKTLMIKVEITFVSKGANICQ